jgi:hypothetical protein
MTHAAQSALAHGAALLFTWILLQQAGIPIPSAPLLIAVGSLASYGRLRPVPSLVAALTACRLSDGFWYRLGRRGWSESHRFRRTTSNWKNRVLSLIWRHSGVAMLFAKFAKFVVGSNVVPLMAGQATRRSVSGKIVAPPIGVCCGAGPGNHLLLRTTTCEFNLTPVSRYRPAFCTTASRPECTIHGLNPFLILTRTSFRRFRR